MPLIDQVKTICDRLAPLGWRDLLPAVTSNSIDIVQPTSAKLKNALTANSECVINILQSPIPETTVLSG